MACRICATFSVSAISGACASCLDKFCTCRALLLSCTLSAWPCEPASGFTLRVVAVFLLVSVSLPTYPPDGCVPPELLKLIAMIRLHWLPLANGRHGLCWRGNVLAVVPLTLYGRYRPAPVNL